MTHLTKITRIMPPTACVLDPAKAACRLTGDDHGTRRTSDITDCRPTCTNIARTDRDIGYLHRQVAQLQNTVDDPLAPPIRHAREQHELARLQQIIADRDNGARDGQDQ